MKQMLRHILLVGGVALMVSCGVRGNKQNLSDPQLVIQSTTSKQEAENLRQARLDKAYQLIKMIKDTDSIEAYEREDGKYLCVMNQTQGQVVILNEAHQVKLNEKILSPIYSKGQTSFYNWSRDGKWIWLVHQMEGMTQDFCRIDLEHGTYTFYMLPSSTIVDFSLNPDTGQLCYSDYPLLVSEVARKAFEEGNHPVHLYMINLLNVNDTACLIDTGRNGAFIPQWTEVNKLIYQEINEQTNDNEEFDYLFDQSLDNNLEATDEMAEDTNALVYKILKLRKGHEIKPEDKIRIYGYSFLIQDLNLVSEKYDKTQVEADDAGRVRWDIDKEELYFYIQEENAEQVKKLEQLLRSRFTGTYTNELMAYYKRGNYQINFEDQSYLRFERNIEGVKEVRIGIRYVEK